MKLIAVAVLTIAMTFSLASCGSSGSQGTDPIVVSLSDTFAFVAVGSDPITITAVVSGPGANQGVSWDLSIANTNCSPGCGTLKPGSDPSKSAVYTPPKSVPTNQTATITARAIADPKQTFVFNFQIVPAAAIVITDKFATQTAGGPVTDIHAQITNDVTNAGISWTLTAGGPACSPDCGTLTADPSPSLVAHYQPPVTPPTGANATPTISASSVATPGIKDSFNFTIVAPPITVSIVNKFSTQAVGGPAVTLNANVANDFGNLGLTWTLTAGGSACSPDCGALSPAASPSFSAAYTPPTTLPQGANANPTITATSVADTSKSDSFSFTIANASTALNGHYAFSLRGFNPSGTAPVAIAGAFIADGTGGISDAEFEVNNGGGMVSFPSPLTGSYTVDTSFNGVPRVTITFASIPVNLVLKGALSSDGKRGQIIQVDNSGFLTAGTLLQQDPAALASDPGGSYAFGVDSDAPVGQRIVEAGQFVLAAGGTSITGGLADATQFGAANPVAGGVNGGTPIASGVATAPDSFGRGTLTLDVGGTSVSYSYYVTDGQQLNLLEIDGGAALASVFSGTANRQKTLDANTINSTGVFALTGMNVVNSTTVVPDSAIGILTVSGLAASMTYDRNTGTNVTLEQNVSGSIPSGSIPSAAFDPATGRVVVANTVVLGAALYYYDTGKAYFIDITPNSASLALSGQLVPQTAGPFSASTDLTGNLIARAGGSSTAGPANADWAANFDGSGNYSYLLDLTTTNTSLGSNGQVVNFSSADIFQMNDTTVGHGLFKLLGGVLGDPVPANEDIVSFYVIGPKQFVAIGNQAGVPSGVLYFDPQ